VEETLIVLLVALILGAPILAIILAIVALVKAGRVRKELRESEASLHREVDHLRALLKRTDQRLTQTEKAGAAPPPDGTPAAEAPSVLAMPPVPAAPPPAPVAPAPAPPRPAVAAVPLVKSYGPTPSEPPMHTASIPPAPAKPSMGLEEKLGVRLFVWMGAIALAIFGALFVKYSIDQGWLSPAVRIVLGVLFGVALLGLGEALRKNYALLSQGCSAAGIADLFACFLAAANLYQLIPPLAAFALMGLTAATAVALSLRQGPIVAVVGLVGGFFTPYWVQTGQPRPAALFGYLLLLQIGLLLVTRSRRWWPLAGLTLMAGMAWAALYLVTPYGPADALWVGLFLLASVAAFLASGFFGNAAKAWGDTRIPVGLGWGALGSGIGVMAGLVGVGAFGTMEWCFLGLLGAACLVMGRLDSAFEGTGWLAAGATAVMLIVWGGDLAVPEAGRFLMTAGLLGGLYAAGAYACLWGSVAPGRWGALSAASALAYFLLAWGVYSDLLPGAHWGLPALVLALLYLAGALPAVQRRDTMRGGEEALAALAVAVTAFVSLAVPLELERQWMAVAWALEVAALCWLADRLRVEALGKLAWAVSGAVVIRLLLNPFVLNYPTGETPVFNWLLYGYGIPLLAFSAAAWFAHRTRPRLGEALQWGALALGAAFLALEVRQYFHAGHLDAPKVALAEWGAYTALWMALGLGLLLATRRWPLRSLDWGGKLLFVAALGQAALTQCLAANPAWISHPVGETPVFNLLLFVYGLPAVLALVASGELLLRGETALPRVFGVGGLALLFVLMNLEIRQAFRGSLLASGVATNTENYAYSAGWVLFGLALLGVGIVRGYAAFRYASLAVMLLSIAKIFLYDLAHLKGTLQVAFSFLSLGASLLLVAFLYMRFVFRRREP